MRVLAKKRSLKGSKKYLFALAAVLLVSSITSYAYLNKPTEALTPTYKPAIPMDIPANTSDYVGGSLTVDDNDNVYVGAGMFGSTVYKYNSAGVLQDSFDTADCDAHTGLKIIKSLQIGSNGEYYLLINNGFTGDVAKTCVQKYSSDGTYISQFTVDEGNETSITSIALDPATNRIFAVDERRSMIDILDTNGNMLGEFGGTGTSAGEFGAPRAGLINGIVFKNNELYVNNYWGKKVQIFDNQGAYLRGFAIAPQNLGPLSAESMTVTNDGSIYVLGLVEANVYKYNSVGIEQMGYRPPSTVGVASTRNNIAVNSEQKLYLFGSSDAEQRKIYTYDYFLLPAPTQQVTNLAVSGVTDTSATISWDGNSAQSNSEFIKDYAVNLYSATGSTQLSGGGTINKTWTYDSSKLKPGTEYIVSVAMRNADGAGPEKRISFKTTGEAAPVVQFGDSDGKKILVLNGENLLENSGQMLDALQRSLITLNGQALPFCSEGIGLTRAELIEAFSPTYPNIAQFVSDTPACYFLYDSDGSTAMTPTQAKVWLPDNFDFTAPGTITVNGTATYTFNTGDSILTPTILIDGSTPTIGRLSLAPRPTFSGVATPGARVVVTVHSDPVTCEATAGSQGSWSCMLSRELPAGAHEVFVNVINPDNSIVNLGPYPITVRSSTVSQTPSSTATPAQRFIQAAAKGNGQIATTQETPTDVSSDPIIAQNNASLTTDANDTPQNTDSKAGATTNWSWAWITGAIVVVLAIAAIAFANRRKHA